MGTSTVINWGLLFHWDRSSILNHIFQVNSCMLVLLMSQRSGLWIRKEEKNNKNLLFRESTWEWNVRAVTGVNISSLSLSSLGLTAAAVSSRHNSLWVTFVSKTFHPMKMFYLISKSSIFCHRQGLIHHHVRRVISCKINQVNSGWIELEPSVFLPMSLLQIWGESPVGILRCPEDMVLYQHLVWKLWSSCNWGRSREYSP